MSLKHFSDYPIDIAIYSRGHWEQSSICVDAIGDHSKCFIIFHSHLFQDLLQPINHKLAGEINDYKLFYRTASLLHDELSSHFPDLSFNIQVLKDKQTIALTDYTDIKYAIEAYKKYGSEELVKQYIQEEFDKDDYRRQVLDQVIQDYFPEYQDLLNTIKLLK